MHVVLRKRQILLLVCSGRSLRGWLACTLVLAPCLCLDSRCPDAEDERKSAGTRIPTGEGPVFALGMLCSFICEERLSIVCHRLPGGWASSFCFLLEGHQPALQLMDLIKTDLLGGLRGSVS